MLLLHQSCTDYSTGVPILYLDVTMPTVTIPTITMPTVTMPTVIILLLPYIPLLYVQCVVCYTFMV